MTPSHPQPDPDPTSRMQLLAIRWTQAQPTVAAFVSSVLTNHHDAEEALQRTAATLVAKISDYDPARPFVNWAIGLARIECLRLRAERRRQRDHAHFDPDTIASLSTAFERLHPELEDTSAALDECLAKLKGRVRQIFELHYVHGHRPADIATKVSRSTGAVFIALHRGREALRDCIERRLNTQRGGA